MFTAIAQAANRLPTQLQCKSKIFASFPLVSSCFFASPSIQVNDVCLQSKTLSVQAEILWRGAGLGLKRTPTARLLRWEQLPSKSS